MAIKDIFGGPPAARRLLICTGPSCDQDGEAQALLSALRSRLEAARLNAEIVGAASCVQRACLGKCIGEPVVLVHPDEVWYHRLSLDGLLAILHDHVLGRRPVTDLILEDED